MPLTVCATPIGNLEDVTLRVLRELGAAEIVLCEDTRRTRALLDHHGIRARLLSYERHSEARRTAELLPRLREGARVALVSDAGLPGVNDPGSRLIGAAIDSGVVVTVLPGPSAVETALVVSGLVGDRYQFLGYLPRSDSARSALWRELAEWRWPAIGFEAPRRLPLTLASMAAALPDRAVAVCRELTKRFEEIVRGTAAELAISFSAAPKGEVTVVIGPAVSAPSDRSLAAAASAVERLVAAGAGRRPAAQVIAELTDLPANRLYELSL